MKVPSIDEPVRLGRRFWILYAIMVVPVSLVLTPWSWEPSLLFQMAGIFLPPFVVSIFLYSVSLFAFSLQADFRGQRRAILTFGAATSAVIGLFFFWWKYFRDTWTTTILIVVALAIFSLVFRLVNRKKKPDLKGNSSGLDRLKDGSNQGGEATH